VDPHDRADTARDTEVAAGPPGEEDGVTLDVHDADLRDRHDPIAVERATLRVYGSLLLFTMTFAAVAFLGAAALNLFGEQGMDAVTYGDGLIGVAAGCLMAFPALGAYVALTSRRIARTAAGTVALVLNLVLLAALVAWLVRVVVG